MSDQDNIFTTDPQTGDQTTDPSKNVQADPSYDFIGEGKKYPSIDDALNSVPHAQAHIEKLESELSDLRNKQASDKTVEDILEAIKTTKPSDVVDPQPQELDVSKLSEIINDTINTQLTAKETATIEKANIDQVINRMSEVYGDKAEEMFIQSAENSGLTIEAMNSLASKSPSAVLKLTGIDAKSKVPDTSSGSINTDQFNQDPQPEISAKVPQGATSKDLINAWMNAGKLLKQG